jgi:hypothetical protein
MAKTDFCIYNKYNRKVIMEGTYDACMEYFNRQDKAFRKANKIVSKKDVKIK